MYKWIKIDNQWTVGHQHKDGVYTLVGTTESFTEKDFEEVGEEVIREEKTKPTEEHKPETSISYCQNCDSVRSDLGCNICGAV